MKILFACDLDNTLIHSYKKRSADDICIEIYDGREQSFITPRAFELIKKISAKILFIPVTTRSFEQYRRIFWFKDYKPRYAFTTNGAIFLDGEQKTFFRENIVPYAEELENQRKKYVDDANFTICRIVDESFLFLRCRDDIDAEKITFDTNLNVQHTGKKIYLFPPRINKGEALKMLIKKFLPDKVICAGDSAIDLPMLELADVAFHEFKCAEEFLNIILEEFL